MFSAPEDAKREYRERSNVLIVIRDGFEGMNFAERYLRVMQRRKGRSDVQVIAVTKKEYERLKDRIERFV